MRILCCSLGLVAIVALAAVNGPTSNVVSAHQAPAGAQLTASSETGMATSPLAPASRDMATVPEGLSPMASGDPDAAPAPKSGVSEAVYRARKAAVAQAPSTAAPDALIGGPPEMPSGDGLLTPGATKSFEGLNVNQCGFIPSDHGLGVGPTYLIQVLNNCVLIMNKKTGAIPSGWPKGLNTFFGASTAQGYLFDPRVLYDQIAKRFIVLAEQYNNSTGFATFWIGISKTTDPTGAWWIYTTGVDIAAAGDFPDFPTMGVDKDILYVCTTVFKNAGGLTDFCKYLPVVRMTKGQSIGGYYYGYNFNVSGVTVDSMQPANIGAFSKDYPRAGFLVNSFNINFGGGQCSGGCNGLVIWAVSNALVASGSPGVQQTGVIIGTANNYFLPPNALQPGCGSPTSACAIDTGDTRISGQVTYTNGSLWASLNTKRSGNNTSTVLWFQIRPFLNDGNAGCTGAFLNKCAQISGAELLNEDCYFCGGRGNSGSDFYAVPVSNSEGDVTMVASYSDLSSYPGVYYVSRRVTQAKNTMHDGGIYLMPGQGFYQLLDNIGRNRWGDYNAAQVDSLDELYFAAQYAKAGNLWGTRIGKNAFAARNQP